MYCMQRVYTIDFFYRKSLVLIPMKAPDAANHFPGGISCNIDMRLVVIQVFLFFKHRFDIFVYIFLCK